MNKVGENVVCELKNNRLVKKQQPDLGPQAMHTWHLQQPGNLLRDSGSLHLYVQPGFLRQELPR